MADSQEERAHWRSVLGAFDSYMQYHLSANHARRMAFLSLPKHQRDVYDQLGYRDKLEAVDEGIRRNAEFIDEMIADPVFKDMLSDPDLGGHQVHHLHDHGGTHGHSHAGPSHTHSQPHPSSHPHPAQSNVRRDRQHDADLAQDKVRSTLRSFVRDWALEGAHERAACYDPCLNALERHFPPSGPTEAGPSSGRGSEVLDRAERKVLVPGCGLGRLMLEIVARGFSAQGNEFSTYMLLGSHWVLNQTTQPFSHQIHPYLHSFSNHPTTANLLRRIHIPDIVPAQLLASSSAQKKEPDFSLVAGDFEEIYGPDSWGSGGDDQAEEVQDSQRAKWDAVVTCFFIDCARNVLNYLRIIHTILKPGGVWINVGPLLWHFENSPTTSAKGEGSVELSLDEVKDLARAVGFDIHEERMIRTTYTGVPGSMLRSEYTAAFWTATKRSLDVHGPGA